MLAVKRVDLLQGLDYAIGTNDAFSFQGFFLNVDLIRLGAGCLLALMPVALYFLFLAHINQRPKPTLVSGPWDFACLLLGLSGFILVGGPVVIGLLNSVWRSYWFGGDFGDLRKVWESNAVSISSIAVGYLLGVSLLIFAFMLGRRKITLIYNCDSKTLTASFVAACEARGFNCRQVVGGIEIGRGTALSPAEASKRRYGPEGFVQFAVFPTVRNATLKWSECDASTRLEIETALVEQLETTATDKNPAGSWLMTTAMTMFFVLVLWMMFLIWMMLTSRPKLL